MTKKDYREIENYMLIQMKDSAHDRHHVYRVLNSAIDIASYIEGVDIDVLIASCLLHDVGREKQFKNLELCHAQIGGDMAYEYLVTKNWVEQKALHVKECISSHRFRRNNPPQSIEAKILFDADKLDVSGAIGIARTLFYGGQVGEPLYILDDDNEIVVDGGSAEISSFFQEYHYKLKKLIGSFHTVRAQEIAKERQQTMTDFYNHLYNEVTENYKHGIKCIDGLLNE